MTSRPERMRRPGRSRRPCRSAARSEVRSAPCQAHACATSASRARPLALIAALIAACAVGPAYQRPSAPAPAAFKEAPRGRCRLAAGGAGRRARRGDWWRCSAIPSSTAWPRRSTVSNQNVAAAVAAYAQAQALVREQRAALFPALGARRARAARRHPAVAATRPARGNAFAGQLGGELGARPLGPRPPRRRGAQRERAGERGRSRRGAPVGAGRARDQLLLAARGRRRDRAAARARSRATSARCRSRRTAMPPASSPRTDVLQAQTQLATTRADLAALRASAPARACDRGADRQGAGRLHARAGAPGTRLRAGGAARRAVGAAAAPARHRRGRARRSRRRTRRSASSARPISRACRWAASLGSGRLARRRPVQRLGRAVVARRVGRADGVRCRRDARPRRRRRGGARRGGRALPADRADGVPGASRTSSRRRARWPSRQRCAGGLRGGRPDRAADPEPLPRRPARATPRSSRRRRRR